MSFQDALSTFLKGLPFRSLARSQQELTPGCVFFAMRGTKFDGHSALAEALSKGAVGAVVEASEGVPGELPFLKVQSTREAWATASAYVNGFPTAKLKLVGITGTNGKTTSTFLLRELWQAQSISSGLIGTVCSFIGDERRDSELTTPDARELQKLFAEMVARKVSHAVMEVSSIALDQFRTVGCQFHTAVFSNLTQDHLDYHGTFEAYFEAKLKLFRDYRPSVGILNADDPYSAKMRAHGLAARWLSFSTSPEQLPTARADFFPLSVALRTSGIEARIQTPEGVRDLRLALIGRHNLANALSVLAVAYADGLSIEASLAALSHAVGAPGRLERAIHGEGYPNVFVDYAHSDDALKNVLEALRAVRAGGAGKIITVFGCGGDRDRTKRPKMASVVCALSDVVVITSDNPRTEDPEFIINEIETGIPAGRANVHREVDRRKGIHLALGLANSEDIVLIAGKGHEDYQILGTKKVPFDDRKVVKEYYAGG